MWLLASVITGRKTKVELGDPEGQNPRILRQSGGSAGVHQLPELCRYRKFHSITWLCHWAFAKIGTLGFILLSLH